VPPEGAVFIGDSEHDIESGRRAGVETAAATWGPFSREKLEAARPTYWLESPEQILALG
jgi:phosphoglycolate phosphatase-like HAD superfamily hydrolase